MKKYGFIMIMCFFVFVSFLSKVNAFINGYELLGKVIFLDAGHGGVDAGSSYNDILEKDINLQIVRLGADIKIECIKCGRLIMLPRVEFNKKIKRVIKNV